MTETGLRRGNDRQRCSAGVTARLDFEPSGGYTLANTMLGSLLALSINQFRYTEIPDHTDLSDANLEEIYAYFQYKSRQPERAPF